MEEEYYNNESKSNIPEGSNNAANVIGWVDKLAGIIKDNGIKSTVSTVLFLLLFGIIGYFIYNPSKIIERVDAVKEQNHAELVQKRTEAAPIIKETLVKLRTELDADRTFVFEAHNGGSNLNGLPFLYMDMTYDEPLNNVNKVMDEYVNVSQSRYALMYQVYKENFWYGNIENLKDIDPELYYRLEKSGTKSIGIISIYSSKGLSGYLGVEFKEDNNYTYEDIKRTIYRYSNCIAPLISNE